MARKMVHVAEEGWLRLVFKGVSHTARVFVDSCEIGGNHNAYTPFTLEAGWVAAGEHEILVHISNEHGTISSLHVPNDYYNYGGLSRPVTLQLIPGGLLLSHVHAEPSSVGNGWKVACRAQILNLTDQARAVTLNAALAGATTSLEVDVSPGTTGVEWELAGAGASPWSPADPALYLLETALCENGQVVDDLVERIGFRTLAVRGEENHARSLNLDRMRHPRFREQCAACNEEMVRKHFNHHFAAKTGGGGLANDDQRVASRKSNEVISKVFN